MKQQLEDIKSRALASLDAAVSPAGPGGAPGEVPGQKGELTALLKQMGKLSPEERPVMGQLANTVRAEIEARLEERKSAIHAAALEAKLVAEAVDVTIPGTPVSLGHQHPMNQVLQEIKDIFVGMGYTVVDGPEVELAEANFTKLNIQEGHPPGTGATPSILLTTIPSCFADPNQPHADPDHGAYATPHPHCRPRPGLPEGRGRRHPFPHVPPD